jgi:hypothetical protein
MVANNAAACTIARSSTSHFDQSFRWGGRADSRNHGGNYLLGEEEPLAAILVLEVAIFTSTSSIGFLVQARVT